MKKCKCIKDMLLGGGLYEYYKDSEYFYDRDKKNNYGRARVNPDWKHYSVHISHDHYINLNVDDFFEHFEIIEDDLKK